ncbi:MAG: GGDEF domain-containing protein [Gemmatimonadaceae bacterium]|nr:GGDEF domain-containing protein [Gemmatimonadaceae bacterium]
MRPPRPSGALTRDAAPQPIWGRPDPALAAAGIEGEYVVARVRLVAMGLLMIAPTWNLFSSPGTAMHVAGFSVTLAATLASAGIWWVLKNGGWRPWVGFASSAFDVSMVSLALVSFLVVASPMVALNSTVTFEMYFLALVATSLRYDARICIVVGTLAIAEYASLWGFAASQYDLADPRYLQDAGPYLPVDLATRLLLLAIATLLSVTIVRRAQRLLYLAAHDRLTGLYNRGHFDGVLNSTFLQAARDKSRLAVAILDVDHFKRINDEHGHAVGDRVLQTLAERLSRSMRRTDVVARYGGEEFVLLMPSTSLEDAIGHVEEVRQEVHGTPVPLGQGRQLTLNFSAGVAALPVDSEASTPAALLTLADHRLLEAKRQGRGRCVGQFLSA